MNETALAPKTEGIALSRSVTLTTTGASISDTITIYDFLDAVKNANTLTTASLWALGDLLYYGEQRTDWGEAYTQALDLSGRSEWTLSQAVRISKAYCRAITQSRGNERGDGALHPTQKARPQLSEMRPSVVTMTRR